MPTPSSLSNTFLLFSQPLPNHLLQATPKENLVLAMKAMGLHPELWQRYLDDFFLHKLHLKGLHSGGISQRVLFQQLHEQKAISCVVFLHCYSHIYHADHAKMANLLQPLNQIQQVGGCPKVLKVCEGACSCSCVHALHRKATFLCSPDYNSRVPLPSPYGSRRGASGQGHPDTEPAGHS